MNRRSFLSGLVALVSCCGFMLEPRRRGALVIQQHKGYACIEGAPADVQEFVELYQTALWPDWREHPNPTARDQMAQCAEYHATGKGAVSTRGKQCQSAFEATMKRWHGSARTL